MIKSYIKMSFTNIFFTIWGVVKAKKRLIHVVDTKLFSSAITGYLLFVKRFKHLSSEYSA